MCHPIYVYSSLSLRHRREMSTNQQAATKFNGITKHLSLPEAYRIARRARQNGHYHFRLSLYDRDMVTRWRTTYFIQL